MDVDKKIYELCYLLIAPEAEAEVTRLLSQYQSDILHHGKLYDLRLAYPIKKQQSALFGFVQFSALPANADKIKASLSLSPKVLRLMLTTLSPKRLAQMKGAEVARVQEQMPEKPVKPIELKSSRPLALTNEALEEKLEEILK